MELAMARRFDEMSLGEMTSVNGGGIFKDADEANLAAFGFAVCAIVVGGPLSKFYGVMAAYAYYEAATGDYEEPAPFVPGNGISHDGRINSGGSIRY